MDAKDFVVCNDKINIVVVGMGSLNYELILKLLKERKPFINILLEDIKEVDMDGSIKFIKQLYNRV